MDAARRRLLAIAAAVSLVGGCGFSKLDPNASVHVTGSVLDASGHPLQKIRVLLFKEADLGEAIVGVTFALGTLGVACLTPAAPSICANARSATSGADGTFSFDLKGSDTQGSITNADTFDMTALLPGPAAGVTQATTLRFEIQRTQLDLPPLRAWDTAPSVSPGFKVSWPALPSDGYGPSPSYTLRFVDTPSHNDVWSVSNTSSGSTVDARLIEDYSADVEVDALTTQPGPDTDLRFVYSSRDVHVDATAGAPPSRGKPCFLAPATGPATQVSPCRLTDGDLTADAGLDGSGCSTPCSAARTSAYIDLGGSKPVRLVAVRGGGGQLVIETSDDAATWSYLAAGEAGLLSVTPSPQRSARYVRVRSGIGVDISSLKQISVWN